MNFLAALFAISLTLFTFGSAYAGEPRNLDLIKQDLVRYHDSGEYQKDIARVAQQATAYLKSRIDKNKAHHRSRKLALVLDIDETALSNYPDMLAMSFGGTLKDIEEAEGKGTNPAIEPTLQLYKFAKANDVAVFFITARRELYRTATVANLEQAGYKNADGVFFLPTDNQDKSVIGFKAATRKQIIQQGYNIVLSVSDQKGDLKGGYADKAFKLPDPYYIVP